ncbi:MAG: hypothetical protein JWP97_3245 [Labilithrix sp.]|nr:hypothetical protein [Labilithrix sp.]
MRPVRRDVPRIRKITRPHSFVGLRTAVAAPPVDPKLLEPVWLVWVDGGEPVGPVSADQVARGLRAGKVPSDASVRHHERDLFWTDLLDVPDMVAALKAVSLESEPPPPSAVPSSASPGLQVRQFMVWVDDADPVGPVSADQIARGIRAGKVPTHASLQRVGDLFACDLLDEPDVIAALKQITE